MPEIKLQHVISVSSEEKVRSLYEIVNVIIRP